MSTQNTLRPIESAPATDAESPAARSPQVFIKLGLVAFIWGGTFIAGRVLAGSVPQMTAAAGRFAVAVPLLLLLAWKLGGGLPRLDRRQLLLTFALGFFGIFLYNTCFFAALARMPAGRTALFVALNPIVVAMASAWLLRERLGPVKWAGIAIAFIGAGIIITRGDPLGALHDLGQSMGAGEAYMLCAVTSWAAYTILGRSALKTMKPVVATTYAALWGLSLLAIGAVSELSSVRWADFGWQVWASFFYLGAFGTVVGFIWYYEGVKAIGPSRAAVFNNLVPVCGVVLAAVLLGESILISMIVGGALAIVGVMMTNR
jgi:drug/metabolite transporter (DMT)-like permease